ncbi:MAG: ABC transporter ATP-binding protein [Pirellulales bacterium]|nr:ABC transporter ATP-binding protein [Pirellulales bacterium]
MSHRQTVATCMPVIETSNLTKFYGRRVGVSALSLAIPAGQLFGFLGPNGAGKTTTIRLLLGLLRANTGQARVLGLDCWSASHRVKAEIGYVPGDLRLYPWMTLRRSLWLVSRVRGRDLTTSGANLAKLFDLEPDVPVRKMSRGMKQKLGLILAMAHNPKLLILDEPTTALDPLVQYELYQELRRRAATGVTVFFSSHTLSEVESLCDRVVIIRQGVLAADATLAELRAQAPREVVIQWPDQQTCLQQPVPACLEISAREGSSWKASLTGRPQELLTWSHNRALEDITIGAPDLETLFRSFYQQSE